MPLVLGQDFADTFGARFAGRLYRATFDKITQGAPDPLDASGAWNPTIDTYACDAIALAYDERDVDGEYVKKGDYRVVVMRASIGTVASDAVRSSLDLATVTDDDDTVIEVQSPGILGDCYTFAMVGDAVSQAGSLEENDSETIVHFLPGSSTVADVEALIASSALLQIKTAGTGGNVLVAVDDELAATRLQGGADATFTPGDVIPNPQDTVTIPPPGETVAKTGRIIDIASVTEAAVTLQVRGEPE